MEFKSQPTWDTNPSEIRSNQGMYLWVSSLNANNWTDRWLFLEGFQKYKKLMAERNNIYKTSKIFMIFRNIISAELSYGVVPQLVLQVLTQTPLKYTDMTKKSQYLKL